MEAKPPTRVKAEGVGVILRRQGDSRGMSHGPSHSGPREIGRVRKRTRYRSSLRLARTAGNAAKSVSSSPKKNEIDRRVGKVWSTGAELKGGDLLRRLPEHLASQLLDLPNAIRVVVTLLLTIVSLARVVIVVRGLGGIETTKRCENCPGRRATES